ncbi:MAG: HD domain-containing protein [Clostridia bacterium]|nr:HD domain-containing protein [Clostridia bacterium]
MIYTPLTRKAMQLAYAAHHGQTDKDGIPYIFHPMHLAEQMTDEATVCVALLHDTVEDTDVTLDQLRAAGFPPDIVDAVAAMTHAHDVDYFDYVRAIRANPIARAVKLADLAHNSDPDRSAVIDEAMLRRFEKYARAKRILNGEED